MQKIEKYICIYIQKFSIIYVYIKDIYMYIYIWSEKNKKEEQQSTTTTWGIKFSDYATIRQPKRLEISNRYYSN